MARYLVAKGFLPGDKPAMWTFRVLVAGFTSAD